MSEYYEFTADKFVFKVKIGLLYSREETWAQIEGDQVRVGVTDFAQRRGGDIVFAEIKPIGTNVVSGELLGLYETVKLAQDILSPIDGEIIETNSLIISKPEAINRDPYGEGWVVVLKPASSLSGLLSADEYFELMKIKIDKELKTIKGM